MALGSDALPRPSSWTLSGNASHASSRRWKLWAGLTPEIRDVAVAHPDDGGGAGREGGGDQAGGGQVDVAVDDAGRGDQALAHDPAGVGARDDGDVVGDVGVAGPPDRDDPAVLDPDVALEDAEHRIEDQRAADDQVELAVAAAPPDIWMASRIVLPKPQSVSSPGEASSRSTSTSRLVSPSLTRSADGRAVHAGVEAAVDLERHHITSVATRVPVRPCCAGRLEVPRHRRG